MQRTRPSSNWRILPRVKSPLSSKKNQKGRAPHRRPRDSADSTPQGFQIQGEDDSELDERERATSAYASYSLTGLSSPATWLGKPLPDRDFEGIAAVRGALVDALSSRLPLELIELVSGLVECRRLRGSLYIPDSHSEMLVGVDGDELWAGYTRISSSLFVQGSYASLGEVPVEECGNAQKGEEKIGAVAIRLAAQAQLAQSFHEYWYTPTASGEDFVEIKWRMSRCKFMCRVLSREEWEAREGCLDVSLRVAAEAGGEAKDLVRLKGGPWTELREETCWFRRGHVAVNRCDVEIAQENWMDVLDTRSRLEVVVKGFGKVYEAEIALYAM